jgi:hypothetical protein
MKKTNIVAALALLLSAAGCGWRRTPVPILSETGSTALLVGSWSGEYNSVETNRHGSISFDLASEKDTAFCDVTMMPAIGKVQMGRAEQTGTPPVADKMIPEPLTIRFIRLGDNRISGTLQPYTDPDCGCQVSTTFTGMVTGPNRIEGTYVTTGGDRTTKGKWYVTRQASTAATN